MDPLTSINTRATPQTKKAHPGQVRNNAGGYTFQLDDQARLRRFLILGVDGGTYYTTPRDHAVDNAAVVQRMAVTDHAGLVAAIVDVSTAGAAPKPAPALFALAAAASVENKENRRHALQALPQVARTGTHLFQFLTYVEQFRGWGRSLRSGVADWYLSKDGNAVAYQAAKYRQRHGWTHRDVLRLSHPRAGTDRMNALFAWITGGTDSEHLPPLVHAYQRAQLPGTDLPALIREGHGLSWEMLPDVALSDPAVWDALLDAGVPTTALLRQLPRLTRLGLLPNSGGRTTEVVSHLTSPERLRRARVHPLAVLLAHRTYAAGQSERGTSSWTPTRRIVDALDDAFYAAFQAVKPAGKRTLLALDVSASMTYYGLAGTSLTPRDASAALALVQMATEPECDVVGFTARGRSGELVTELPIGNRQRLSDAVKVVSNLPFGGTDCALPMLWAQSQDREYDQFVVYTDSETWAGRVHPHQALRQYRDSTGIPATLAVVGMTSTGFTIADPDDPGMLDVVGFDQATPGLLSEFARGYAG